jgi:ABC-type sugar transport system substrate-binding protein
VEATKKIGAEKCIYTGPPSRDVEKQVRIINDLIAQKVNGIAVELADPEALLPALRRAKDANIAVVTIGNDLHDKDWPCGRLTPLF